MTSQRFTLGLSILNVVLLAIALAPARWTAASDAPQVLRGRSLEIVDERGRVRAGVLERTFDALSVKVNPPEEI